MWGQGGECEDDFVPRAPLHCQEQPENTDTYYCPGFYGASGSSSGIGTDPLALTPECNKTGEVNIYAKRVSNFNTDKLLSRLYDGGDQQEGFGRRRPKTSCGPRPRSMTRPERYPRPSQDGRVTAGQKVMYLVSEPCPPPGPKIGQRCRTSRVVDRTGNTSRRYFAVSRSEELAAQAAIRRQLGQDPAPTRASAMDFDRKKGGLGPVVEKTLSSSKSNFGVPRINSTMLGKSMIQMAIKDLSKLPDQVEQIVSKAMKEPGVQENLFRMATKKLNIPTSTKVYRDLLDIDTVPEVTLKRVASKEKKPVDPVPSIEDYIKPEYSRVMSATEPFVPKREERPALVDINSNLNEYDLMRFERVFISL